MSAALDPIITTDHRGTVLSASDSVERLVGWRPSELIGHNVSVLMPERYRGEHDGYIERHLQTGMTRVLNRPMQVQAVRRDGSAIAIEICITKASVPGQDSPLFVAIMRDARDRAEAERNWNYERVRGQQQLSQQTTALQAAHLRLRIADRLASMGTLAAGLGHDMNNVLLPVRARINALRAAGERGEMSAGACRQVDEIRKGVAYLQQLADGLHFLAMDPEKEGPVAQSTELGTWWGQVGALVTKAVPKRVRVKSVIPAGLPRVRVPAHRLTQAMLNLVVNAGDAIPAERKRRQGRVCVCAESSQDGAGRTVVRLSVTDNGSGMTEEVKRRAFEMFFTTKPRGLGTGLGLPQVRQVVDRAGGSVEIESRSGRGTTVTMVLPVAGQVPQEAHRCCEIAVMLEDGRADALVRHVIEGAGGGVAGLEGMGAADGLVTDDSATGMARARAWRNEHPDRPIVLLGGPPDGRRTVWRRLHPVMFANRHDLHEIRRVLMETFARDRAGE